MASVEWIDELIHRAEVCLKEARGHGEVVIESICRDKLTALHLLRDQEVPEPRPFVPPQRAG